MTERKAARCSSVSCRILSQSWPHSLQFDLWCNLTSAPEKFETVGHWCLTVLPKGWSHVAGFGIRQDILGSQRTPANVSLREDTLGGEDNLSAYIQAQAKMLGRYLGSPEMAGPQSISFGKADEAFLFLVRHAPVETGPILHAQTYVRFRNWIGIVTLTTSDSALDTVRPDYDAFLQGLAVALE
jgi:hypothetical protein